MPITTTPDTCDRCSVENIETVTVTICGTGREYQYCANCASMHTLECSICHETRTNGDIWGRTPGGRNVCETCHNDHGYFTCTRCDAYLPGERYEDDGYCDACHNPDGDDEDDDDRVADYHSTRRRGFNPIEFPYPYSRRPAWTTYGSRSAPKLLLGVELEIESRSGGLTPGRIAARARQQLGTLYAGGERDGSLQNGVEIITHPATIDAHRVAWRRFDLRGSRAVSHDSTTCGLHVHFTRNAVSPLTVAKVVQLFGDPSSTSTWSRVFRRNLNRYAEACRKPTLAEGSRTSSNRYECVNTTSPHTVEIRWSRGTLQARTIVATIEIVHAAIRYCEQASTRTLTAAAFLAWVCRDPWARSETTTARRYLIDRGLVGPRMDPTARVRPGLASLPAALADDAAPIPDATPARDAASTAAAATAAAATRLRRTSTPSELDPVRGVIQSPTTTTTTTVGV